VARRKVLVTTSSFASVAAEPLERLRRGGIDVQLNPYGRTLTADEVGGLIGDVDGLIAGTEPLDEAVLSRAARLTVISRVGVGLENVDLAAAERRGIAVRNTPDAVTGAVAELTVGGLLALLRHLPGHDADVRAGRWQKRMGALLGGKTVGIVGLGRVGRRVAELLTPFGTTLIGHDVVPDPTWAAAHDVALESLPDLLAAADVVCIHASGGSGCLVGEAALARMRPGAYVVNTARPELVDEDALAAALGAGRLAGAYLDVFSREPYDGPLRELPNVLLTPHVGSYASEARLLMELEAVDNLLDSLPGSS
jgi:D-3-phosphoglycerate dehydrogenase